MTARNLTLTERSEQLRSIPTGQALFDHGANEPI